MKNIEKAMVIGAGVMGAAIAGHLANAGLRVLLLDVAPDALTEDEKARGLGLKDPGVRTRFAMGALERLKKARPPALFSPSLLGRIEAGNLKDDLDRAAEVDWVIEAVVEDLEVKRTIMRGIEHRRRPGSIVSTNTSGIPIRLIAEGLSGDFQSHFLGTHFFNPPRYLKLLELVPSKETDRAVVEFMKGFGEERLGKSVVLCKDTPNFIANRVALFTGRSLLNFILDEGYTVEEVDALTGPLLGRPKTANFRLLDLIGMDIALHVGRNLQDALPDDPFRDILRGSGDSLVARMVDKGFLGNKSGGGFYRRDKAADSSMVYQVLDLETLDYRPMNASKIPLFEEARRIPSLRERTAFLLGGDDRYSRLLWHDLAFTFSYCSTLIPHASETLYAVDDAVKFGFSHEMGPFETWDVLGMAEISSRMEQDGYPPATWVRNMMSTEARTFYGGKNSGRMFFDLRPMAYSPVPRDEKSVVLEENKAAPRAVLNGNAGASLFELRNGLLCLEFHTKGNAIDQDVQDVLEKALERLQDGYDGLVLGNQGKNFCIGANVRDIVIAAEAGHWDDIEGFIREGQDQLRRLRYAVKPVVSAPFGMTLGGGAEIVLASDAVCASAETYMGLGETGVGLIPAGGGCCGMVRRLVNPHEEKDDSQEALNALGQAFETILLGKVSTSALEAREMGFLAQGDRIVMNGEHVMHEAARMVGGLHGAGYAPPSPDSPVFALGRAGLEALEEKTRILAEAGRLSDYDVHIARELARVLCGGDHPSGRWVDELHMLDLEREVFLKLCGEEKTSDRIRYMMKTGQRFKN